MPMHAIEKILAKASGNTSVSKGQVVYCDIDVAGINDLYWQVVKSLHEMGEDKVWNPEKVAILLDHQAPAPTIKAAINHQNFRKFACEQGITNLFDVNAGTCHQVITESGLARPGTIVVLTDSHSTTYGAVGAFGTGVGATELAGILATGKLWFRVPEVIKIILNGTIAEGVLPKDIILYILGQLGTDGAVYKVVEFTGPVVENMDLAGRMVLCNMTTEMGAKTAYTQPNDEILEYVKSRTEKPFTLFTTDADYEYSKEFVFDISELEPQLAVPHNVDNARNISDVKGVNVDQVFIGSCTGGRIEDVAVAAKILKGKKVANGTRMIIIPASGEVLKMAVGKGYFEDLIDAGAVFATPGCGPCLGGHQGILAPGEVCVSTSNRNFKGRMGSKEASIYLASPATAAASALEGRIADPRKYLEGGS
ncbi:MAG: 3-isopropylmalate dehydratase large subunit [Bacillota bacterium]